jgi:16S rRNA (guanine1516-N2)-methyltransferase
MPDIIPITVAAESQEQLIEQARQCAQRWGLAYQSHVDSGLVLLQHPHYLALRQLDEPKVGEVLVDFASDALTFRRLQGRGKKEAIAKAVGFKGQSALRVLDATAGLGRDAFVLANLGCHVDMIERSPVVAALLEDGLQRAAQDAELSTWLPEKMHLFPGIALELLKHWQGVQPEVVYLDPMFPHRKKSAAVKKEMRLFQQLLGPDEDADKLLEPGIKLALKRVVVKRPTGAPYLNEHKPDIEYTGKTNRFDVYLTKS